MCRVDVMLALLFYLNPLMSMTGGGSQYAETLSYVNLATSLCAHLRMNVLSDIAVPWY